MDAIKLMGELYRRAQHYPEGPDKWLFNMAANCVEHTLLEPVSKNKTAVLLHIVQEELVQEEEECVRCSEVVDYHTGAKISDIFFCMPCALKEVS